MLENNMFENEKIPTENENFSVEETPENDFNRDIKYVQYIPYGFTVKTFEEKKNIKRATNAMSISVVFILVLSLLYGLFAPFLMMSLGYSLENTYQVLREPGFTQVFQIFFSVFTFTVPFIVIYKLFKYRISDLISFDLPKRKNLLPLIFIGISFCSFANIAVSYASQIFEGFGINYDVDYGDNPEGFFGFMLSLIATVIVPALVEEFSFRGIILGSLRKFGDGFAIVVSSIIFGIMHGNFEQMPFAFLVGLALGFVAIKTSSIWPAVLIHGFNNFISVFFNYFMDGYSKDVQNIIYTVFLSFTLLLGIIGLLLLKNSKEVLSLEKADTESEEITKYKWVFTSPFTIIFIAGSVILSLSYLS